MLHLQLSAISRASLKRLYVRELEVSERSMLSITKAQANLIA